MDSKFVRGLKNLVSRSQFTIKLFRPIYHATLKRFQIANTKKNFRKNACSVLHSFHQCMEENGCFYTLAFGSLLGAIREKGFIKHDFDIDVYMWAEDYDLSLPDKLRKYGFRLAHDFMVGDGKLGREQTFEKNGVGIDIFYVYPPIGELPYCCDFILVKDCTSFVDQMKKYGGVVCRRLELPFEKERIVTKFEDFDIYIPKNAHELLRFRYGDDYMIPNPKWTPGKTNKYIIHWNGILGKYQAY